MLQETEHTHLKEPGWPPRLARSFRQALYKSFPEALVDGYQHLIDRCANDPKDSHVLACAAQCQAEVILTFNLRDFPSSALRPWNVEALHPQDYLLTLYGMDPVIVVHKLETIARSRGLNLEEHLIGLGRFVPAFARKILEDVTETD